MSVQTFSPLEFVRAKREGLTHTPNDLRDWCAAVASGSVPEYQVAAWLMAVVWRDLQADERSALTRAICASGEQLQREPAGAVRVDKHSTGGVGDKTSLLLIPLLLGAANLLRFEARIAIPMISGRGLELTGGTLDKLEAIPGFRIDLNSTQQSELLSGLGAFVVGASPQVAPADRIFYALRDVTATVNSRPLIVSSILGKKLAASLDALVLDVKAGSGAFLRSQADARLLAEELVATAEQNGVRCRAVLTTMDEMLGRTAGNLVEVIECDRILRGDENDPGQWEVTTALAEELLALVEPGKHSGEKVAAAVRKALDSGTAFALWERWIAAQGGDLAAARERFGLLQQSDRWIPLLAPTDGYVHWRADAVGRAALLAGAGRTRKEDSVSPDAGVWAELSPGMKVAAGERLGYLGVRERAAPESIAQWTGDLVNAVVQPTPPASRPRVSARFGTKGFQGFG